MDNFSIWVCEHLNTDLPDHSFKLESGRLPARVPRDATVVQLCEECRETYRQAGSQDGPLTEYPPVPKARWSEGAIEEDAPITPPASARASMPGDFPKSVGHWDPSGEGEQN